MMQKFNRFIFAVVLFWGTVWVGRCAGADAPPADLMRRAEQLVRLKPTSTHLLGWVELSRAAGQSVSPESVGRRPQGRLGGPSLPAGLADDAGGSRRLAGISPAAAINWPRRTVRTHGWAYIVSMMRLRRTIVRR